MQPSEGENRINYSEAPPTTGLGAQRQTPPAPQPSSTKSFVQWKASEFIDHQKSSTWFFALIGIAIILSAAVYAITRDVLATLVMLVGATAFGMYAKKTPRTLTYSLGATSFKVGERTYRYDDFRSFSVMQEGALYSVVLESVKRFMPPLTIYFAPEDGEEIFDVLAQHLPHEERRPDFVDNLMRKIRF